MVASKNIRIAQNREKLEMDNSHVVTIGGILRILEMVHLITFIHVITQ